MQELPVTIDDINTAYEVIKEDIIKTSCTYSSTFSKLIKGTVRLKLENLQLTGAYKVRGALYRISKLSDKEKKAGVIAASAGNHAQGVAYAAKKYGICATIVMPITTPLSKVEGTKKLGAKVVLNGHSFDESHAYAVQLQQQIGATFIHPFNDLDIIAGQGSIGLELLEQFRDVDIVLIPIGGGGLASGVSIALKSINSKIRIIGIETENMPAMQKSIQAKAIVKIDRCQTIAEGIAVAEILPNTFSIVSKNFDEIVTVTEASISRAIIKLLEFEKVLCEGAGAVSIAAILEGKIKNIQGKKVCAILSGGNIDLNFLEKIINRGLTEDGRLVHFNIIARDIPGNMADICSTIGNFSANILEINHNRYFSDTNLGEAAINVTMETKGPVHTEEILAALRKKYTIKKNL